MTTQEHGFEATCAAEEPEQAYDLLDDEEDAPDANDLAKQELVQRYNSQDWVRYFPEDEDPRLDWANDGVRALLDCVPSPRWPCAP